MHSVFTFLFLILLVLEIAQLSTQARRPKPIDQFDYSQKCGVMQIWLATCPKSKNKNVKNVIFEKNSRFNSNYDPYPSIEKALLNLRYVACRCWQRKKKKELFFWNLGLKILLANASARITNATRAGRAE